MKIRCLYDQLLPISKCVPHNRNRNIHPADQLVRLSKILEHQGWRYPVKISKLSGFITSGHGRVEAARLNGWTEIPVNFQDYDNEEQEYSDVTADNAVASWAELDLALINQDLGDLGPFDIDMLGIKDFEVDPADKFAPQCDEDEVPDNADTRCKLGDIWKLDKHRIMCGSSTDPVHMTRLMNNEIADLLITDPPYGVSYVEKNAAVHGGIVKNAIGKKIENDSLDIDGMFKLWKDVFNTSEFFTDKASYYVFSPQGGEGMMMMMQAIHQSQWQLKHELIWAKQNFVFGRADYHYQHEPILYGWKKNGTHVWYGDRKQSSVLNFDKAQRNDLHPTSKPVALIESIMMNSSKRGDLVVDLFLGSGTTLISAQNQSKRCYGMEIDPNYCDVILTRFEQYTGLKAEKLENINAT